MEDNHKLTLYVTYYLSRFNNEALTNLGYTSWNEAYIDVAEKLNVKKFSVRNWRDEFDPLFGNRAGWHQRPMSPSRVKVVQALENLDELQIRNIVKDILSGKIKEEPEETEQLLSIASEEPKRKTNRKFVLRAPTGKAAEDFFILNHKNTSKPVAGKLIDCRDLGCGYDFKIVTSSKDIFIEVKGITAITGGILFTDKEWRTALEKTDDFFLCIVRDIGGIPKISFIQNPSKILSPKRNLCTVIQLNWSITENQLAAIYG